MSVRTVTGFISKTDAKPFEDRKTGKPIQLHSFQLEGSNQWFRTGRVPVPAGVGTNVKFVADGANVDTDSFETITSEVKKAPAVAAAAETVGTTNPTRTNSHTVSKDDYWANKEARDLVRETRYQEVQEPRMALSVAVEAASRLVQAGLASEAISFGTAAKGKRVGLLAAYTKEIALDLATFIKDAPNQLASYKPEDSGSEKSKESMTNVGD